MRTIRVLLLSAFMFTVPVTGWAQLISLKSIPVATGDQFLLYPSQYAGMGGVSLALPDSLLDPFVNPAKGARLHGGTLFGTPTYYGISNNGSARTIPVGMMFRVHPWFGGVSLALQQLGAPPRPQYWIQPAFAKIAIYPPPYPQQLLRDKAASNLYASGFAGLQLGSTPFSVAGSVSFASLNAMDGVDLLYPQSRTVEQSGSVTDARAGFLGDWANGHAFEALAIYNRVDMTHDVTYENWVYTVNGPLPFSWQVRNLDQTRTWGFHTGYMHPIGTPDFRLGGIVTVNRKTHPHIPNYDLMNLPRDPGDSWALNLGAGIARRQGKAMYGLDVIYEPIWSHTWGEQPLFAPSQTDRIPVQRVDNHFRFSNLLMRMGIGRDEKRLGFQLGLQAHAIRYTLEQDVSTGGMRHQRESWIEWTGSWGAHVKFSEFQLRYLGRMTTGTGRPDVLSFQTVSVESATLRNDFIVAPGGPLTLLDARVLTHQLTVTIPLQ